MRSIFYQMIAGVILLGLAAFELREATVPPQHSVPSEAIQLMDTVTDDRHSGDMVINGKSYADPVVYASYDGAIQIELWQQSHLSSAEQPANLIVSFNNFTGPGTYTFTEANHTAFSISGSEEGKEAPYTSAYKDSHRHTHYGPAFVTITQYEGTGKPLVGMINATLYQNGQHSKPIQVSGSFRVVIQG